MNNFESIEGKTLAIIYDLYITNQISYTQKGQLKDYFISQSNAGIQVAITSFKKSRNEQQFVDNLLKLVQVDYSDIEEESVQSQKSIKSYLNERQSHARNDSQATCESTANLAYLNEGFRRKNTRFLTQYLQ